MYSFNLQRHDSQAELYFNIAAKTQIIGSFKVENVCKDFMKRMKDIKRLAEMFEIWFGCLISYAFDNH